MSAADGVGLVGAVVIALVLAWVGWELRRGQ